MKKNGFIFCLFFLFTLSCVEVKNRVKITSGTYRIVSMDSKNNSLFYVRSANKNDSVLGLGIDLNVDFYSDGKESEFFVNAHTEGEKGLMDNISEILISTPRQNITTFLKNDTTSQFNFKLTDSSFVDGEERYICTDGQCNSFLTYSFLNFDDFIKRYNVDRNFIRYDLNKEFFLWFDSKSKINYEELEKLEFKIIFSDGRSIKLDGNLPN